MLWNWEHPDWPHFRYDPSSIMQQEREFLVNLGSASAFLKNVGEQDYYQYVVEILSQEGYESSKIEEEFLDRESLQSSIRTHFGLQVNKKQSSYQASAMGEVLCEVFDTFDQPLIHKMLFQWHEKLSLYSSLSDHGKYRTHAEPMQIVATRYGAPRVFFEALPSKQVLHEMSAFINWYNSYPSAGSILGRAAITHVYFENIHPFEDGNGRVGRLLVEIFFSQSLGKPVRKACFDCHFSRIRKKEKRVL